MSLSDESIKSQWLIYLMMLIGRPYQWGGKSIDKDWGLDCSGFVGVALEYFGINPPLIMNAHQMWRYYSDINPNSYQDRFGSLVFFGSDNHIHHVGICLKGDLMIESAHGGPSIITKADAIKAGAKIEVNKITRFNDLHSFVWPLYPWLTATN